MARHTQALQGLQGASMAPTYDEAYALERKPVDNLLEAIMNGQHASRMEQFAPVSEQLNQPMNPALQHGGRLMVAAGDDMGVEGGPFGEADTGPFGPSKKKPAPAGLPIQALHGLKGAR